MPPATRSSSCRTGSTPIPSRPSRSARRRPGSPSLRGHGFAVEHPAGRSRRRSGRAAARAAAAAAGPRIGILAEYDALPGLGHGCGHNTMAASGVGAAIALAAIADELPGEIVFLGTPAEERGSGKQIMIDDGLFEGIDAALLFHPVRSEPRRVAAARVGGRRGRLPRAPGARAADPWRGRNALDAMILLFSSVGLWRQQLRPDARVHGIIQEGGTAANIIPERTRAWFMLRSPDQAYYERDEDPLPGARRGAPRSRPRRRSRSRSAAGR